MGFVWAAHHELIGRHVAIKITRDAIGKRQEVRDRFLHEARTVGKLRHSNIIDVVDVGQIQDGPLYIVFELLDGTTLADYLEGHGKLAPGDAAVIVIEVCHGLEAAHAAGVVHRDLKPANIFLHRTTKGGTVVKLLDFGISKLIDEDGVSLSMTQTGVVMGTPQYMSTEQARGRDDVDLRTDIWSAGAILYELLTGSVPFDAGNYNAMIYKIMHEEPPLLSGWGVAEPALQSVVSRALAKQRSQRFQSAKELRTALESLLPILPRGSKFRFEPSSGRLPLPPGALEYRQVVHLQPAAPRDKNAVGLETMAAPPSRPSPPLTPLENPAAASADKAPDAEALPSVARRRTGLTFLGAGLGAVAIAVFATVALRQPRTLASPQPMPQPMAPAPKPSAPPVVQEKPQEEMELAAPSIAPHAVVELAASAPTTSSASASASSSPSPRKRGNLAPRAAEAPKSKSVTRVDSAGF